MIKLFTMGTLILSAFLLITKSLSATTAQGDLFDQQDEGVGNSSGSVLEDGAAKNGTCGYNVTHTGSLSTNGTIKSPEECVWRIIGNDSLSGSSGLLFEEIHLHDDDNLTVHLIDANETLIFGPYHGIVGRLVIIVDQKNFTVKLSVSEQKMNRVFHLIYSDNSIFAIPPNFSVMESPIYRRNSTRQLNCSYDYSCHQDESSCSFVFPKFSLDSQSKLTVTSSDDQDGDFTERPPDIFGSKTPVRFNMILNANSTTNALTIVRRNVYRSCSQYIQIPSKTIPMITSPPTGKSYNDSTPFECRWLIRTIDAGSKLGLKMNNVQINSVFDMLTISNGPSELSPPILQATYVNQNETKVKVIQTSGPYMWISFRSQGFVSAFSANYSDSASGGYYNDSGLISMDSGSDAVFLLEVASDEKVILKFSLSDFTNPATLRISDSFDAASSPVVQLNGNIWYPVVSTTSRMMVNASHFDKGKFSAEFSGMKSDCIHMSSSPNDAYIVSGNCNSSCGWIVPPQSVSEGDLSLGFQLLSLDVNDIVEVFRLSDGQTSVAKISHDINQVPPFIFSATEGFCLNVTRGNCSKKDDVILIAHSTYLPGCSQNHSLEPSVELQLSSPDYPNLYPLFAKCMWNISASGNTTQFHVAFNNMNLAPNHTIQITHVNGSTKTLVFTGDDMPDDMLLGNMAVYFDSANYNKSSALTSFVSGQGFVLNITSSDCGGMKTDETGQFNTNLTASKGPNTCIWIIQVPYQESDKSVNSIMFTVAKSGEVKGNNSEFDVHDGASVRDSVIKNLTGNIWSRNNTLVFIYKRLNSSLPSDVFTINYKTISCNKTMQCENGICLHPDWRCDGKNDCGDFTDEKDCETVPVPKPVKPSGGVSGLTFGLVTVLFFVLGALAAFLIPKAISRYRSGRYHQFQDYPGAD